MKFDKRLMALPVLLMLAGCETLGLSHTPTPEEIAQQKATQERNDVLADIRHDEAALRQEIRTRMDGKSVDAALDDNSQSISNGDLKISRAGATLAKLIAAEDAIEKGAPNPRLIYAKAISTINKPDAVTVQQQPSVVVVPVDQIGPHQPQVNPALVQPAPAATATQK